jgi:hypothetical protein
MTGMMVSALVDTSRERTGTVRKEQAACRRHVARSALECVCAAPLWQVNGPMNCPRLPRDMARHTGRAALVADIPGTREARARAGVVIPEPMMYPPPSHPGLRLRPWRMNADYKLLT